MGGAPEVAVVVGAYGRATYLRRAVDSVLAQSLARSSLEVVVVSDLELADLRPWFEQEGVTVLRSAEPRIGPWLLGAVDRSSAPVLAFLDDDDEFAPDHLANALAVLRESPDVGFYRNRVRVIDPEGRALPIQAWRQLELDPAFDRTGPVRVAPGADRALVPLLARDAYASFNTSTMLVRREILSGPGRAAFERSQLPDLALTVIAALSPYALYLDDRRTTCFRFHPAGATRRSRWLWEASDSHAALANVARTAGRPALAQWLESMATHYERLYRTASIVDGVCSSAARATVAAATIEYLRFLGRHAAERAARLDVWSAPAYGGGYVFLPWLARRVARSREATRRG
jgi:hypothetical protein